jgi:ABC-type antimicrobial peptide transport system permease subunit
MAGDAGSDKWGGDFVRTMNDVVGSRLELQRFRASALSLFSLFGLVLASMGVYGVVASVVNQRTAQLGIRVALGASRANVLALVARGGIGLTLLGIGVAGTLAVGRVLASIVVTDGAVDLSTTMAASAILAPVVAVACYLPGRRAARIDPTRALRES